MKTFEATDPLLGPGGQVSSHDHPFQSFQWADYTAKPEHDYTYTVIPLYGTPAKLKDGDAVSVKVTTESEWGKKHSVFFNRGAVATQEYARRFQNIPPDKLKGDAQKAAYLWLSRGLLAAFTEFVGRAKDSTFGLSGAFYEFQWPEALQALKAASDAGADVAIIYDAIPSATGPKAKNEKAIQDADIEGLCTPRTNGTIMHNKFLVLTKNDVPIAIWTGSTNLTENGIFGHSNCGHAIEDKKIAKTYLDYWTHLKEDAENPDEKTWVAENNPNPPDPWTADNTVVFSPRTGLKPLTWYEEIAGSATEALFMTLAFGMHKGLQDVCEKDDSILRLALMEKEGNGSGLAQGKIDIARIRKRENVVVAIGHNIATNSFDRWLQELPYRSSKDQVHWIHTKYMLVDPLSDDPIVITGSANFSEASTNANNENMIVIHGDTRVADIYLGEYMRLFAHYAFREAIKIAEAKGETDWHPEHLKPDDSWQKDYFTEGNQRFLRRKYFSKP
jgi:phosphatidylserine/phosphatidylglycerophosphate/cardiolipin synthase-like enzyme